MMQAATNSGLPLATTRKNAGALPRRTRRIAMRVGLGIGALLAAATVFIGFLHTKAGHPMLMRLAGFAGCPMGGASAAQVDVVRRAAVAKDLGTAMAPTRPALGFVLDKTTLADVRAWEKRVGVECTEEREATLIKCDDVSSVVLGRPVSEGRIGELSFGFSPRGPLVSVTTLYAHRSANDTASISTAIETGLARELGSAHKVAGSFEQVGTTATLAYRFRNYAADLTSSRVPGSGYAIREQYMSTL